MTRFYRLLTALALAASMGILGGLVGGWLALVLFDPGQNGWDRLASFLGGAGLGALVAAGIATFKARAWSNQRRLVFTIVALLSAVLMTVLLRQQNQRRRAVEPISSSAIVGSLANIEAMQQVSRDPSQH